MQLRWCVLVAGACLAASVVEQPYPAALGRQWCCGCARNKWNPGRGVGRQDVRMRLQRLFSQQAVQSGVVVVSGEKTAHSVLGQQPTMMVVVLRWKCADG